MNDPDDSVIDDFLDDETSAAIERLNHNPEAKAMIEDAEAHIDEAVEIELRPIEFEVHIEPFHRSDFQRESTSEHHTVYDLRVRDRANGKILVFSNQGYENRQDAVDLAEKLFRGRPAQLNVWNADKELDESYRL